MKALAWGVLALSAVAAGWAASTGNSSLLKPQGSGASSTNGDYVSATDIGGGTRPYHMFIEVPPSLPRLVLALHDADVGQGGTGEAAARRDRDRSGFNTPARYELRDPTDTLRASLIGNTSGPGNNTWLALFDSNSVPAPAFVSSSPGNSGSSNVTSISVALPGSIVATDYLIALVARDLDGSSSTVSAPSGWTSINQGNCPTGLSPQCSLAIFGAFRSGIAAGSQSFTWSGGQKVVAAILAYRGVHPTIPLDVVPTTATGSTPTQPSAPAITTVTNNTTIVRFATEANGAGPFTPPSGHTERIDIETSGSEAHTNVSVTAVEIVRATTGTQAAATITSTGGSANWRTVSIALRPNNTVPNGHWELRLYHDQGGDDINAVGIQAHDGNSGAGGVEIPVYADPHLSFGINAGPSDTFQDYVTYPWITSGCQCSMNNFDIDVGNGTGLGPSVADRYGRVQLWTRGFNTSIATGNRHQDIQSASLSADNAWQRNTVASWTSDQAATEYGIWRTATRVSRYDNAAGINANYGVFYYGDFAAPANAPPTNPATTPVVNGRMFRQYLPTDGGAPPAKPYLEQLLVHVSGPNPPQIGQTTRFGVTVRIANPSAHPITFSSPTNVIIATVPGAGAVYAGSAAVGQGSITSQPTIGGTGNIVWNPGVLAAGGVSVLAYRVDVTPTMVGQRVPVTATPAISPSLAGTRAHYLDETANASQARATARLGPICELAATEGVTLTQALIGRFDVIDAGPSSAIEWETSGEDGTLGFHLYRRLDPSAAWQRLDDRLITAQTVAPQGAHYRFWLDQPAPPQADYALVEVEAWGSERLALERLAVTPSAASPELEECDSSPCWSRVPKTLSPIELDRISQPLTTSPQLAPANVERAPDPRSRSPLRMELLVRETGWQRVGLDQLALAAGVSSSYIETLLTRGGLRLEHAGTTIGARTSSQGLEFYGQAPEEAVWPARVYVLTLRPGAVGVGTAAVESGIAPAVSTFRSVVEIEQNNFAGTLVSLDPRGDFWYWASLIGGDPTWGRRTLDLDIPDPDQAGSTAELHLHFHGASATGVPDEHTIEARWNGTSLGISSWDGIAPHVVELSIPTWMLAGEQHSLEIEATVGAGAPHSFVYLDRVELHYDRIHRARDGYLELVGGESPVIRVAGFPSAAVSLYDVSNPARPVAMRGFSVVPSANGFDLILAPQDATTPYVATSGWAHTPEARLAPLTLRPLHHPPTPYIVIAPSELLSAAERLAEWRWQSGLPANVISLESIYDTYRFGHADPDAIRDFLADAWSSWDPRPRYVVLLGQGDYDYRNHGGLGGNLIPARMVATPDGLYGSDSWFGDLDDDGVAEISVGRVPVSSDLEAQAWIDKLIAHESSLAGGWAQRATLLADHPSGGRDFGADAESFDTRLVGGFDVEMLDRGVLSAEATRTQLLDALTLGTRLLTYYGHGGFDRLSADGLLGMADVDVPTSATGLPILNAMTCSINRFELPGFASFGEAWVRHPHGGAIASYGPSGLSPVGPARSFGDALADTLFRTSAPRLGDALLEAQRRFVDGGGDTSLLLTYTLLGDPGLRLDPPPAPSYPGSNSLE